jgi:hypothetical protein
MLSAYAGTLAGSRLAALPLHTRPQAHVPRRHKALRVAATSAAELRQAAAATGTDPLFQPLQLGAYELQHRVVMAPLTRCRWAGRSSSGRRRAAAAARAAAPATRAAQAQSCPVGVVPPAAQPFCPSCLPLRPACRALGGLPQPNMVEYYRQRASEGGLIVSEATCVSEQAHGYPCTPTLYLPGSVEAWKPVVQASAGLGCCSVLCHAVQCCAVCYAGRNAAMRNAACRRAAAAAAAGAGCARQGRPRLHAALALRARLPSRWGGLG